MLILNATQKDIPELLSLINSTFRGDASKKGWTTEADLLEGDLRTDEATLVKLMQMPGAVFLKYVSNEGKIDGCVYLDKQDDRLYLGMLSVSALLQAKGIGKQLMSAADQYARQQNCEAIFMRVITVRHELVAWYERQGFVHSGKKEPFPTDNQFGIPTQPLEFTIMEKEIK